MLPFRFSLFCFSLFPAVLPFSSPSWCSAISLFLVILPGLPSSVPAVSVPVAVFGVCFRLLSLFRVLSSCVDPSPLFCFFHCLRVLVGPFPSACPRSELRFPLATGSPVGTSLWFFPAFLLHSVSRV